MGELIDECDDSNSSVQIGGHFKSRSQIVFHNEKKEDSHTHLVA